LIVVRCVRPDVILCEAPAIDDTLHSRFGPEIREIARGVSETAIETSVREEVRPANSQILGLRILP